MSLHVIRASQAVYGARSDENEALATALRICTVCCEDPVDMVTLRVRPVMDYQRAMAKWVVAVAALIAWAHT